MRRVEVEWIDSLLYHDGWQPAEHWQQMADDAPKHVYYSAGYLAAESEHGVVIVTSRSNEGDHASNGVFIPRGAIRWIKEMAA